MKNLHVIIAAILVISLHRLNAAEQSIQEFQTKIALAATEAREKTKKLLLAQHTKELDVLIEQEGDCEKNYSAKQLELTNLTHNHLQTLKELIHAYELRKARIEDELKAIEAKHFDTKSTTENKKKLIEVIADTEWTEIKHVEKTCGNGATNGPDAHAYLPIEFRPAAHLLTGVSSSLLRLTGFGK